MEKAPGSPQVSEVTDHPRGIQNGDALSIIFLSEGADGNLAESKVASYVGEAPTSRTIN